VQHERVCIRTELGNDERHPLRHQASDEATSGESIESGDGDRTLARIAEGRHARFRRSRVYR
jgi:hypothetical protein